MVMNIERIEQDFVRGNLLFSEGEEGDTMYIILEGKVLITKSLGETTKTLAVLEPGDFFGEMSLLTGETRSANAMVSEDSRMLVVDQEAFSTLVSTNAKIAWNIMTRLAYRLRESHILLDNLLFVHPLCRVANTLLKEIEGRDFLGKEPYVELDIPSIARKTGLTTEKVRSLLIKLDKEEIISKGTDCYFIHKSDALRTLFGMLRDN